jgi:hypothetical protein
LYKPHEYKCTTYGDKIWLDLKNSFDPSGFESDLTWFFKKVKLTWTQSDLTQDYTKQEIIRDKVFETRPDLIRTRTTRNLRWPKIRLPEIWPDPNSNDPKPKAHEVKRLKIWPDPNSNDPKFEITRNQSTRNPTQPDFKRFKYN